MDGDGRMERGWAVTLYCRIRVLEVSRVTSFFAFLIGGAGLTGLEIGEN